MRSEQSQSWSRRHRRVIVKWALLVIVAGIAVAVDLVTKWLAEGHLALGETHRVLPFLHLQRTVNDGVAFGLLGGHTWAIVAMNLVAFVFILVFVAWWRGALLPGIAGGLIIGGFLGNLVQRVSGDNLVTDFLKFPHWPNYNMADVFLVLGICLIVLGLLVETIRAWRSGRGGTSAGA